MHVMDNIIIIITIGIAAIAVATAAILYLRYRRLKRDKARSITQCIHQQDRIIRELEHTRTEKETLERVIRIGIEKITGIGLILALCYACAKDPVYNTDHPAHGKITLTTNWDNRTPGIPIPDTYHVRVGSYMATLNQPVTTIDNLFVPDTYPAHIYTMPNHIYMEGTVAKVATLPARQGFIQPQPGWLFSCMMTATIERDTEHQFTAVMRQQMRSLTLVIQPTGGTTDRVKTINATLTGVAGEIDLQTQKTTTPMSVEPPFALNTTDGKYYATLHLLGTTGTNQNLDITLSFANGTPNQQMQLYNLAKLLEDFNADKETPLTLEAQLIETPTETGFTATITNWTKVSGTGTAN